jgi:hypothetical protein
MNSFSSCADGWCSLYASRSSNTNVPSSMSSLACSYDRRLSVTRPFRLLRTGVLVCQGRHPVTDKAGRAAPSRQSILEIVLLNAAAKLMFTFNGDGPGDSVAAPWQRTETKKGVPTNR